MKLNLITLIFASILCACKNSEEVVFHESENVSAVRHRSELFQQLLIGSTEKPYTGTPSISLRAPEIGEIQITQKLKGELLRLYQASELLDASKKVTIGQHPGRGPRTGKKAWGAGATMMNILNVKGGSIKLVESDRKIIGVAIYGGTVTEDPIEVKTANSNWHAFPLSREALMDLFGEPRASYQWMAE